MKNILLYIVWFFISTHATFADWWILGDFYTDDINKTDNVSNVETALKYGEIHTDNIPTIIKNAIDFLMSIAWTIAVIFIIVWAYKLLFGSLSQDKTKWKDTIIMAISWFAIASLAWFIIRIILDNLWV